MLKNLFKNFKNWRIDKINRQKDKEDEGIILPLSHSHGLKVIVKLQLVKIKRKFLAKKWQYSAVFMILILFSSGLFWLQKDYIAKGATYGWVQSSWSGGADTNAVATHTNDQEGWTKFYSKDSEVAVDGSGHLTLSEATSDWTQTSDADFNAGTKSDVYVTGGNVQLLKPLGASCSVNGECISEFCSYNLCADKNSLYDASGSCGNFWVFLTDVSGTKAWKTTNSNCDTPQCGINGGQDGDNLVADNNVDFSLYPARNACKDAGGRLPTRQELSCIYTNRASFGNNFQAGSYWSSTETSSTNAWHVNFTNGYTGSNYKTSAIYVRCVLGQ